MFYNIILSPVGVFLITGRGSSGATILDFGKTTVNSATSRIVLLTAIINWWRIMVILNSSITVWDTTIISLGRATGKSSVNNSQTAHYNLYLERGQLAIRAQ